MVYRTGMPPIGAFCPLAIILIFLKRYLKINCTGDGIKGGLDADCLVKKRSYS